MSDTIFKILTGFNETWYKGFFEGAEFEFELSDPQKLLDKKFYEIPHKFIKIYPPFWICHFEFFF